MSAPVVSIVGAGPGDPGLLTRKALLRLRFADLVLYDALVNPKILRYARKAQRFFVGKRAGRRAMRQETINRLMIDAARRGKRVVRLKGGDPFVLGRGGEEALALRAAGLRFDIVPGVSSATAAAALSGIPVTHRGLASGFVVVAGHAAEAYEPVLWSLAPGALTIVVLMGLRSRRAIAELLLLRGWSPTTPAAVLIGASTAQSARWIGPLRDLGEALIPGSAESPALSEVEGPGTIVIGRVVGLAALLGQQESAAGDGLAHRKAAGRSDAARPKPNGEAREARGGGPTRTKD
ncbi:MAG: uroporphyrinogen-III C-methyltransferase [Acidobacteria bacterium]|nr:uroporphyrinogen-III C-methyltransferase [Acidobacteriota bacterium]